MFDLIAVGELLIDFTPIKNEYGTFFKENPGGAPCNMLTMAQKLGSKTAFIGKVGKDQFGIHLGNVLKAQNIDVSGLIFSEEYNTTLAFVHLDDDGDRSFSFYRNGCADVMLEKSEVEYSLLDKARALHFGSLSFTNEPSRSTVVDIIGYAKEKGKLITYDPNYRPALWASEAAAVVGMKIGLEYADIIKVSEEEAVLLTGEGDFYKAAERLYKDGIKLVCVTLGEKGSFYYHKNGQGIVNGYKSKVVDTTGAGRTELVRALFGAENIISGEIFLRGKKLKIKTPRDAIIAGIVLGPEDRKKEGLCTKLSIRENVGLANLDQICNKAGIVSRKKENELTERAIEKLKIKTPSPEQTVNNLSGGNQQKIVVGKWMVRNAEVVIFDEPTRGIDVAAKVEIYNIMNDLKKQGIGVIFVSSEMPEVMCMSDRILVMCNGKITGDLVSKETTQDEILRFATKYNH